MRTRKSSYCITYRLPNPIDKVAASLQEFDWRQPIVVDRKGVVICGHTRLLAAQKLD
jgi:ParB-like chromosome segregation protein Spo0J